MRQTGEKSAARPGAQHSAARISRVADLFLHRVLHRTTTSHSMSCGSRWINQFVAQEKTRPNKAVCVYFPSSSGVKTAGEIGERSRTWNPASSAAKDPAKQLIAGRAEAGGQRREACHASGESRPLSRPWLPETHGLFKKPTWQSGLTSPPVALRHREGKSLRQAGRRTQASAGDW
jgi:hypothetical protein